MKKFIETKRVTTMDTDKVAEAFRHLWDVREYIIECEQFRDENQRDYLLRELGDIENEFLDATISTDTKKSINPKDGFKSLHEKIPFEIKRKQRGEA